MSGGPVVVAVLTHRDPPLVRRLVERVLESPGTVALVHHDPRGPRLDLPRDDRVLLVPEAKPCDWGRPSLARGVLRCLESAVALVPELAWFLLVSGQDYPVRSMASIEAELRASPHDAYLRWFRVDEDPPGDEHTWQAVCRRRYLHRLRLPYSHRSVPALRRTPFSHGTNLYIGDMWVNLGTRAVAHVLEQRVRLPAVERYLYRCSVPDEALVSTLLLNDAGSLDIVQDRRRFIRWTPGQAHPAFLDTGDLAGLRGSQDFFARKVDEQRSGDLLDLLDLQGHPGNGGAHGSAAP